MLGGEDVLAGWRLRPVIPTNDGAMKSRRCTPARGALHTIGERVRELRRAP